MGLYKRRTRHMKTTFFKTLILVITSLSLASCSYTYYTYADDGVVTDYEEPQANVNDYNEPGDGYYEDDLAYDNNRIEYVPNVTFNNYVPRTFVGMNFSPYGNSFSFGVNYGWNSFYSPWYDPFYDPYWCDPFWANTSFNRFYSPWN